MKLISITGSGRSGSTFLSLLLTQNDDVFNLGQVRDFWQACSDNAVCSCGEPLASCAFWSRVVRTAFGASPFRGLAEMQQLMAAFRKDAEAVPDWTDGGALARLARDHADYIGRLGVFLAAAREAAQADAFLDISKSPDIALAFGLVPGADVRVLNLVRDPRAVAVSWEKKMGAQMAVWSVRTWVARQSILARWSRALGERFLQVRYEDLVAAPRPVVGQILAWAGLKPVPGLFASDSRAGVSWARQHLFPPANEKVLAEKRTAVDVVPADEWRKPENLPTHGMVEMYAGDMMAQFGYRRSSF